MIILSNKIGMGVRKRHSEGFPFIFKFNSIQFNVIYIAPKQTKKVSRHFIEPSASSPLEQAQLRPGQEKTPC